MVSVNRQQLNKSMGRWLHHLLKLMMLYFDLKVLFCQLYVHLIDSLVHSNFIRVFVGMV
jgi:hypothetical protein